MKESYVFYMDQLRDSYLETFTEIRQYCLVASEYEADTEERLSALLDEFLQAQEQNIPVERIVGKDLHRFCENLWADMDWKNRLWATADRIKPMVWWLTGMLVPMAVLLLADPGAEELQIGSWMSYGFLACTAMILWYIADAVCKGLLRRSRKMPTEWRQGLCFVAAGLCSFGVIVVLRTAWPTLLIPVIPGLVMCVAFLSCYYYLNRKRRPETRSVEPAKTQDDPVEKMLREDTAPIHTQMWGRLRRINRRRIRRGKMPLTQTEFTNLLRNEIKQKDRWMYITIGLMGAAGIGVVASVSPAEMPVMAICTAVAMWAVLYYVKRFTQAEDQRTREWIEELENHSEWWEDLNK